MCFACFIASSVHLSTPLSYHSKVRALSKQMVDELAAAGTIAEERISNVRTVRALGNDELEIGRYAHQVRVCMECLDHPPTHPSACFPLCVVLREGEQERCIHPCVCDHSLAMHLSIA